MHCGLPQGSLLGPLLLNIFINDVNYCVATSSLRLYADDTTQYSSSVCPMTLEFTHNADISRLKEWFTYNYLGINSIKTRAMVLGNSSFNFEFFVDPQQVIDIKPILKILGATLDNKLSFKDHVTIMLKKAYAKKRLIPSSIMISLYKTYVLPHLEYCSPLLLGVSTLLKNKLEKCNFYALRTVLNLGKSTEYKDFLRLASMDTLTQRRLTASLIMFFKAYRLQGASYISNFFTPRVCHYNLRSSALNVSQPVNTSSHIHSSFSYIISHSWNQLPSSVKSATTLAEFKTGLSRITTLGCKCNKCISIQL